MWNRELGHNNFEIKGNMIFLFLYLYMLKFTPNIHDLFIIFRLPVKCKKCVWLFLTKNHINVFEYNTIIGTCTFIFQGGNCIPVLRFLRVVNYDLAKLDLQKLRQVHRGTWLYFRMWRKEFPFCPQVCGCEISGCWYSKVGVRVRRTEVFGLLSYVHSSVNVARSQTENARHSQRNPTGLTSGQQNLLVSCDRR